MSHNFNYDSFIEEFSSLQKKMLFLERNNAKSGFHMFYKKAINHFSQLYEENKEVQKGDKKYFIKKQTEMIMRYIKELQKANKRIHVNSEIELIKLFEKQYKLKKIILKLQTYL